MRIDNTWTAVVTPFNKDFSVDWDGYNKNVQFQINQGITGIVPVGTTGESPTLNWEEHNKAIDEVIAACKGKCGVLAGTGSNSTDEAIKSSRHAVESGTDAVLLMDCYYNGPSSQELRDDYYARVASELKNTTVVPYIIPGRTGTVLAVEDLALLASRFSNITAVKEATGDLERMAYTRKLLGDDFSIVSGDDDLTFKMMTDPSIKADGVISVISNVIPASIKKMVQSALDGDIETSEKVKDAITPLLGIVTVKVDNPRTLPNGDVVMVNDRYRNPLAVKTLMAGLGMPCGPCRTPLGKMTKAGVEIVRSAAKIVWQNNPEVLAPIGEFYNLDINARLNDDSVWQSLAI